MTTTSPDRPDRARSQPQRVFDSVAGRIRAGELKPGDRVPSEPELMRELGVSRTVVREAMSRLQASGMVQTRQGVGTFVLTPPASDGLLGATGPDLQLRQVFAMLELRVCLEAEAASLAAARRSDAQLLAMREALDAFQAHRRAGERTAEADYRFHAQIAAATGNEFFEEVMGRLGRVTIRRHVAAADDRASAEDAPPRFGEPRPRLEASKGVTEAEHEAIYDAIRRRDPAAARAAMFMHLSNSRERLRAIVGPAEDLQG